MKYSIILLAAAFATHAAFAHPGKTDAKGGHTDSETGKYHVHPKPDAPKKKETAKKKEAPKKTEPAKKKESPKKKK